MSLEVGAALQSANAPASEARELEAAGFHYACAGEHVSFNVPAGNSFISLSVAAGATTTIKLMSTIVLAPLYPPALLAKLGAALDVASGGRYHLGVGIGGEIAAEFRACGIPVGERGARTNEALEIIRLLWSTDRAELPRPVQRLRRASRSRRDATAHRRSGCPAAATPRCAAPLGSATAGCPTCTPRRCSPTR